MPKKQPNKVGMTLQYSYGLSSLYLLPFFQRGLNIRESYIIVVASLKNRKNYEIVDLPV